MSTLPIVVIAVVVAVVVLLAILLWRALGTRDEVPAEPSGRVLSVDLRDRDRGED